MSDVASLVGAYALDAVSDDERRTVEDHLASCADCRDELDSFRETAVALAAAVAVPLPAATRERIVAAARGVRPLPPAAPAPPGVHALRPLAPRRPARRVAAAFAAVAASVAIALGATTLLTPDDDTGTVSVPEITADDVMDAADAQRVQVRVGDASATLVRSVSVRRAVIVTTDMPPAPAGHDYALWFETPDGAMVAAGTMPRRTDQTVLLDGDASRATGVGITVEPTGERAAPSSAPVVTFDLTAARP